MKGVSPFKGDSEAIRLPGQGASALLRVPHGQAELRISVLRFVSSVTYYLIRSYTSGNWLHANPKSEYRNSKQTRSSNDLILQTPTKSSFLFSSFGFLDFGHSGLFRVSDFVLWILTSCPTSMLL